MSSITLLYLCSTLDRMANRPHTTESIARNLRVLMKNHGYASEKALEKDSGVAQKTINNILNGVSSPTIETVEKLARPFGLTGWHLIMPNLPEALIDTPSMRNLFVSFIDSSAEGRSHIEQTAAREAKYAKGRGKGRS